MIKRFCAATGVIALAAAAHGQDGSEIASNRTPASAQKFLVATPPEMFTTASGAVYLRDGEVSSPDACTTVMSGTIARYSNRKWIKGEVRSVPLGVTGLDYDERRIITSVAKGYPAQRAGLKVGDEIVSVNGQPTASSTDFNIAISRQLEAGGAAQVGYRRNGITVTVAVIPVLGIVGFDRSRDSAPTPRAGSIDIPLPIRTGSVTINWSTVQQIQTVGDDTGGGAASIL